MKSIPLLVYAVSAGLFGFAAWTVYEMLPLWKEEVRIAATSNGQKDGQRGLALGKGSGAAPTDWRYDQGTANWWAGLKEVNLIGKLPPPPPDVVEGPVEPVVVEKPIRPLEEIIELVSIAHDGQFQGRGGFSHVIVRFKPEANVQPPEWYMRENMPPTAAGVGGPRDVTSAASRLPQRPGVRNAAPARPVSPMPTSMVGREILQKLWVDDGGDPRRSNRLWPGYEDIQLVRVAADAQAAYFVRTPPPPKAGETPVEPKEEELLKTSMNLSQDVARELRRLQGRDGEMTTREPGPTAGNKGTWTDVEETTLINGVRHIGRKDSQRFAEDGDRLFEQLHVDTYVSKSSDLRGLIVRNVDPKVAQQFGVAAGEVLLEVNNRPVQTQAQALQLGKSDYNRGVRTFVTKWLANGQVIERIYQAPDR
jgi:hypothetical protein